MLEINHDDFIGKTIARLDTSSSNVMRIWFTDGTYTEIWCEVNGFGGIPFLCKFKENIGGE